MKLLKLSKGLTGYFYNSGSEVQDIQGNEATFTYDDFVESTVVEIQSAAPPAGSLFSVCRVLRWIGETRDVTTHSKFSPSKSPRQNKMRQAVLADNTGFIQVSFWEEAISQMEEGKAYNLYNVKSKIVTTSFRWKNMRFLRTMNESCIFQWVFCHIGFSYPLFLQTWCSVICTGCICQESAIQLSS